MVGIEFQTFQQIGPHQFLAQHLEAEGISRANAKLHTFVHVDIHTGVGPYKHDSLLAENCFLPKLERVFGGRGALKEDWHLDGIGDWVKHTSAASAARAGESKSSGETEPLAAGSEADANTSGTDVNKDAKEGVAYTAKGHIGGGLFYESTPPHMQTATANWLSVTQEFGTEKGTKMFQLLRAENALTHWAAQNGVSVTRDSLERKQLFDAFCPASPEWRKFVLARGKIVFDATKAYLVEGATV